MGRHINPPHRSQPNQDHDLPNASQPPCDLDKTKIIDDLENRNTNKIEFCSIAELH